MSLIGSISKDEFSIKRLLIFVVILMFLAIPAYAEDSEVVIKAKYPDTDGMYDEHSLFSRVIDNTRRYFIRITFDDPEGELFFNEFNGLNNIVTSRLFPAGSAHANLVDLDFLNYLTAMEPEERAEYIDEYIFNNNQSAGEAYLYIPIRLLQAGTTYDVIVNPNIVLLENDEIQSGNLMTIWSFNTMSIPYITGISPGSVVEGYDEQKSVIISGGFFADSVDVYFGDTKAYRAYLRNNEDTPYLEVYLPRSKKRLEAGMYDVTVENSSSHEQLYNGVFSVLPEGDHLPNADYRVKNEIRQGDVISSIRTSEDTLVLSSRYRDARRLEFNLDELMGEDVLVRKVEFEGRRSGDRISELITRSKWADITVSSLSASSSSRNEKATISLGRVEPFLAQSIQTSLWERSIKSELIQVVTDNCRFERARISIPFSNSSGDNLKVLRYDEITRRWYNVDYYTVNLVDRRIVLQSFSPGIFVVVE
ncbi:MAG: hypothetical protein APF76_14940 [Desulfitibacter sp. BRH_c19]|nr:MAG: hypothetical protein APF76_14940 [Desulfitibacter sp. BRH_c19]